MLKTKAATALSTILLTAMLAVCANSAQAQQMNVQGFAVKGCNEYLQARAARKEDPWIYWVQGYLSGANMARLDFIMTSAALPPPESMAQSIERYCRAHPLGTMLNATEALYKDLLATSPMQLPAPSTSQRRRP
ncbi:MULTISPECIES: HdeA/HdeB family chaperone [unclassified Variovorax]|jgi:hypothetical protein|uniref:HdeA/HdeB family chaperone n=1 Tax=unclassified Variovorax TaxID=663243 RepID=UPI002B2370F2|nr:MULTISPECIES: HdeA/HdeB family chaperone [unclassified Variovorax]MEB0055916.1 HdeA/HdeB family chaperone [Variovorax sp. LG9.2]MEB0112815.1 HdeA/HdeB family chaperone [Variovorax sp. RTB1]